MNNKGISKLAAVLSQRMQTESTAPLVLDIAQIQENNTLVANSFPVPLPLNEYSVCRTLEPIKPGDTVLIAWVGAEAIVIEVIVNSNM